MKPLILVSNDDGVSSEGIAALRKALLRFGDVVVVAPEGEQSATSHSLTLHHPLRLKVVGEGIYSLDGTPADCVYVALFGDVLPKKPDLVVSGVNRGLNLGQDVFYSGTVAAAREGALKGIPALATSGELGADVEKVAVLSAKIAEAILQQFRGRPVLYNLNTPAAWNGEVRTLRLGIRHYEEAVYPRKDPRGRDYLWLGGPNVAHKDDPGSDTDAFDQGYATLTPLALDLTDVTALNLPPLI